MVVAGVGPGVEFFVDPREEGDGGGGDCAADCLRFGGV